MVGIIAEYNPLHNGHIYHLKKVKELHPDEVIVLILAGHFLNRGDVSIINKWDKTLLALQYGVDLVIEFPTAFACQAADLYAYGAIQILDKLKCDYLVFGSESDDINYLKKSANEQIDQNKVKLYMKQGLNYPTSIAKTKENYITTPNDILGISYIKAINKLNSTIIPQTIKRTNSYHDLKLEGPIVSASSIRNALKEKKDISSFVPNTNYIYNISLESYFTYLKHQILIDDIEKYQLVDSKLANSLKKKILEADSIEQLISLVKTKNYTYNMIKRTLVHILIGFRKEEFNEDIKYIRVLGFNNKGKDYLHKIKKNLDIPLYTNYHSDLALELRATKVYSLALDNSIVEKETKQKPIIL